MMIPFEYLHDKYKMNITGVFHIGANRGQEKDIYDKYCDGNVFWVEAIPSVYDELMKSIEPYPKQMAIKACLSNSDGESVVFNISNNEAQSSSFLELGHHSIIHPEVKYVQTIELKTTRGDTLLDSLGPSLTEGLNLLNIDVQGAELHVLQGLGSKLAQFDYAIVEINKKATYLGGGLVEDVDYILLQNGFERLETGAWVAETWTDGFYKKVRA